MTNTVCTFYELTQGDDVQNQGIEKCYLNLRYSWNMYFIFQLNLEFFGLDQSLLLKALKTLEALKRAELILFGGNEGVKFFWIVNTNI